MPAIVWFRRDLRLHDQTALHHAPRDFPDGIVPVFIFDDAVLKHPDCGPPIVSYMIDCLSELRDALRAAGGDLIIRHGKPLQELKSLAHETAASAVYYNKDYAPGACERDLQIEEQLPKHGVSVRGFKDLVIFEEQEILSASKGEPYTVYTPYRKAWMAKLAGEFGPLGPDPLPKPKLKFATTLKAAKTLPLPTAELLGHPLKHPIEIPAGESAGRRMLKAFCARPIDQYKLNRNLPALANGTSRLSPHLRHGTISVRQCLRAALNATHDRPREAAVGAETWIGELIWREFYQQILFNFPHVETQPFKEKLNNLNWSYDKKHFAAWCEGRTGFPIVDAAMRQLNTTGWMHNRLRMITAMFLTKDLRIDWRWGERYFMQHLIDGETAQNNGGWQWSASTGTDAQPWFRIFNPTTQSKNFDPDGKFIRRFVPELKDVPADLIHAPPPTKNYPPAIIDHAEARTASLAMFKQSAPHRIAH